MKELCPSEIYYSQDSISNFFSDYCEHGGEMIGETLDAICEGRCDIDDIPAITVAKHDGEWVTCDNRRLWIFKKLEKLDLCDTISVHVTSHIPPKKMTRTGDGSRIRVRGSGPGGKLYKRKWYDLPEEGKYYSSTKRTTQQNAEKKRTGRKCTIL